MVNKARGEVELPVEVGGETKVYKLALTMGALAMMEDKLGKPVTEIGEVFDRLSIKNVQHIIHCLIIGGGDENFTPKEFMRWKVDFALITAKIRECFELAGFTSEEGEAEAPEGKPESFDPVEEIKTGIPAV